MKRKAARTPSEEERALFESALGDAKPLKPGRTSAAPKPAKPSPPKPAAPPAVIAPRPQPSGLDGRTAERLRKGAIAPDAKLDLHGLTEESAHRALITFLRGAMARGARLALIVTGKGKSPAAPDEPFDLELDRRTRGVLKAMVPRWLQEPELARVVADIRPAHRRHGGSGALYVYLRKERKA
jgi:DNA-nicking Smr family endonuclease